MHLAAIQRVGSSDHEDKGFDSTVGARSELPVLLLLRVFDTPLSGDSVMVVSDVDFCNMVVALCAT